jgi:acetylornithine/N-succinyldiaminopimelate aminotransferase
MLTTIKKTTTDNLIKEAEESLLFVAQRPPVVMQKGEGMYLWDTDGKKYLDFIGGWAVDCLGHCPKVMQEALLKQGSQLINASPSFYNKPMIEFAKLLTDNSCFDKVFFASTGAEANEGAIKLARKYGEKFLNGAYEIITTINGFHGRTLATMSASGKVQWKNIYEPKVPGFKHVSLNNINELLEAINENTCAIMLEPIQGEAGVNEAEIKYVQELRKICDEKGILLIFDEVQTGIGRTGTLFGYEHYGIQPDIMTLAKGIGGGYPLSALLTKEKYNIFEPGDQGGTYCGQPLGMAVGFAVVNEVIEKNISQNAKLQGEYIKKRLFELQEELNIKNIRGEGLLLAFDFQEEIGKKVVDKCLEEGLILNSPRPAAIRLMPPLIVSEKEIDDMFKILVTVVKDIKS